MEEALASFGSGVTHGLHLGSEPLLSGGLTATRAQPWPANPGAKPDGRLGEDSEQGSVWVAVVLPELHSWGCGHRAS